MVSFANNNFLIVFSLTKLSYALTIVRAYSPTSAVQLSYNIWHMHLTRTFIPVICSVGRLDSRLVKKVKVYSCYRESSF